MKAAYRRTMLELAARESFRALRARIRFDGGALRILRGEHLEVVATDPPVLLGPRAARAPRSAGLAGWVLAGARPRYVPDLTREPMARGDLPDLLTAGARSYLGVPLIVRGDAVGVLQLDAREPDAFPDRERALGLVPEIAAALGAVLDLGRPAGPPAEELLALVSHELRSPVTSIRGLSETLAARALTADRELIGELSQRIAVRALRLQRLVADLLDLSSAGRGRVPVRTRVTELEPVVREAVSVPTSPIHELRVDVAPEVPQVRADPDRLLQVLDNLLSNAAKFSDPDRPIAVLVRPEGDRVAISVQDQGPGIAPEMRERVFEPFTRLQANEAGDPGGIGIGLAIVRTLCLAMGAEVDLQSQVGVGTTVTIRLPVAGEAVIGGQENADGV